MTVSEITKDDIESVEILSQEITELLSSKDNKEGKATFFHQLNLQENLIKTLNKINFSKMTDIQSESIPIALEGKDILGSAQTGTGKTGAFVIPIIEKLLENNSLNALILSPTRELAMQISDFVKKICNEDIKISSVLLIGGDRIDAQLDKLRKKPRIIIGTPGRVIDHLERKSLNLNKANFLVLDETDRMLDMGFGIQLDRILEYMPKEKQTLMFSATISKPIEKLSEKYLTNPKRISIGSNNLPIDKIIQTNIKMSEGEKSTHLFNEINKSNGSIIIFVKTKYKTEKLSFELNEKGYNSKFINGDLHQNKRKRIIEDYRREKFSILVATDVAARGLDISHIRYVINYDLPESPEDYIHRIGRTARAGAEGNAISFITPGENKKWQAINWLINPDEASKHKQIDYSASNNNRRRSFNDKNSFGSKKPFGDRKPYSNRSSFDQKNAFGGRYKDSNSSSSEKFYGNRNSSDKENSFENKKYHDDKNFASQKPYYGNKKSFSNQNNRRSEERSDNNRSERSFDRSNNNRSERSFDRTDNNKSARSFDRSNSNRPERSFDRPDNNKSARSFDRPEKSERPSYSFAEKPYREKRLFGDSKRLSISRKPSN